MTLTHRKLESVGTENFWNLSNIPIYPVGDVNKDGIVNVLDLVLVAGEFGVENPSYTDVNGDGVVNILDLVVIAQNIQ